MHFVTRRLAGLVLIGSAMLVSAATPAMAQTAGWQPGPGAILDNTYDGVVDVPANGATVPSGGSFAVSGWFVDTEAQGWSGADDAQTSPRRTSIASAYGARANPSTPSAG